ncbi:hypothetical protein NC651_003382 [Populus alba x Populus x berolinensis]|nr:hypothetical protein NC651_003382 [Populus alba x Populus x berolinensis]
MVVKAFVSFLLYCNYVLSSIKLKGLNFSAFVFGQNQ